MNATLMLDDRWRLRLPGGVEQQFATDAQDSEQPLPDALRQALAALPMKAALTVQIAGGLARWLLLPPSPRLVSEGAWAAFAQARFEQQFALPAAAWTVRWLVEPPGQPRLMLALPNNLLAALRALAPSRELHVQVQAGERLAALRRRQPRFTGAFCDLEAEHCVLVLCLQGRPVRVRKRAGALDASSLGTMLKTEWAALQASMPGSSTALSHLTLASASAFDDAALAQLKAQGIAHIERLADAGGAR